ncbi:hypothetical protein L873DRAFT_193921 [Choiromyces venosus 120613-1]|uniref:Uncharacterized protein n=1 Tax=Choiromyces venosus 120613-1 TaxID=1336337 RepID=A0A3N4JF48_9PEZI|nr:hypothetical protein L873DRAFT_193921 [Choiromyces venosus 120613-1]
MIYFEHCIHFAITAVSGTRYKLFHPQFSTLPRHLPFCLSHRIPTSLQEILQSFNSYTMTMATTVVRYIASFSCASLSPAATLQRGLTADLRCRFISSSGNDNEATAKVDVKNRLIDAGNFVNKAGLKPAEVDVGNGPRADVMVSPSTGILKQTTITNEASRLIYRDMQATTPTDPHVLDAMLPVYTGLYGDPYSRSQDIEM